MDLIIFLLLIHMLTVSRKRCIFHAHHRIKYTLLSDKNDCVQPIQYTVFICRPIIIISRCCTNLRTFTVIHTWTASSQQYTL